MTAEPEVPARRGRLRSSPYWPVLTQPSLRRVLPGLTVSSLGDGMSFVAVTWLALQLAPAAHRGTWVAVAAAAYSVPAAAGTLLFGRWLRHRPGAHLVFANAVLRAAMLAAIVACHLAGVLSIALYIGLLAASSLLHSWGQAGQFTVLTEVLPDRDRVAGNATLAMIVQFGTLVGPAFAGLLIAAAGPAGVLAVDAGTFVALAVSVRLVFRTNPAAARSTTADGSARTAGFRAIRRDPRLFGLLALTLFFYLSYGPVEVALPVHIAVDLHRSAAAYGGYVTAFSVGAVLGGLLSGYLRRLPLWPTTVGIVFGWGLSLLPIGLGVPAIAGMICFAVGGLIYAPYPVTSVALHQRATTPDLLPHVLAARSSVVVVSTPLGIMLGGPLIALLGARGTLLASALATLAIATAATTLLALRRARPAPAPRPDTLAP